MTTTTQSHPAGRRGRKVKFGNVTVTAPAPPLAMVLENIKQSTQALSRAVERLARPGVRLRPRKGTPLYSLDSDDPGVVIRQLDGKTERGRIRGGEFCVID